MDINWKLIIENFIPIALLAILSGICWLLFFYRKDILTWFKKVRLILLPINFNIALSLDFKEGLNSGNYFNEIKKKLEQIIDENKINKFIILKDFSDVKKFHNTTEAEQFRTKKNIDLIIWGGFSGDSIKKDGQTITDVTLNFTYGHPDNKQRVIGSALHAEFNTKFAKKNYWKIIENNSYEDLKIITNNVFDISMYILATVLLLYGKVGKSINLLESLYTSLNNRKDKFAEDIVPRLCDAYQIIIIELAIKRKNYNLGKEICEKILKIKSDDFFALSNLTTFQYWTGEFEKSEKNIDLLLKVYPKNPLTELNVAYTRLMQKNYSNAYKHYQNLLQFNITQLNFNPSSVLEFLGYEYEKRKEPAILYASGIISANFGDKDLAKKDLELFLKEAPYERYDKMYRDATKKLKKL